MKRKKEKIHSFTLRLAESDHKLVKAFADDNHLSVNQAVGHLLRQALTDTDGIRRMVTSDKFQFVLFSMAMKHGGLGAVLRAAAGDDSGFEDRKAFQEDLIQQLTQMEGRGEFS
jgi:hypothetical protein